MRWFVMVIGLLVLLGGCGVSETAVSSAAVAAGKAREAEVAKQTQEQLKADLEAATQQAQQRLQSAESASY